MIKAPRTNDMELRVCIVRALLSSGIPRQSIKHEITLDMNSSDGRADIVVALDGCLTGIELKSGKDKLDRLETQRDQYMRRFDKLCLVVDRRHQGDSDLWDFWRRTSFGSLAIVERDAQGSVQLLEQHRGKLPWAPADQYDHSKRHVSFLSPAAMLSMLWQPETYKVASDLFSAGIIPTGPVSLRWSAIEHLSEHASISKLRPLIARSLRERQLNRWEESFWKHFDTLD
jgi:hypothetical protein